MLSADVWRSNGWEWACRGSGTAEMDEVDCEVGGNGVNGVEAVQRISPGGGIGCRAVCGVPSCEGWFDGDDRADMECGDAWTGKDGADMGF